MNNIKLFPIMFGLLVTQVIGCSTATDLRIEAFESGRTAKAVELFQEAAVEAEGNNDKIYAGQSLLEAAAILVELGRIDEAEAVYNAAANNFGASSYSQQDKVKEIGYCYQKIATAVVNSNPDKALKYANAVLELDSTNLKPDAVNYAFLIEVFDKLKMPNEAYLALEKVLSVSAWHPKKFDELANRAEALGLKDRAATARREAAAFHALEPNGSICDGGSDPNKQKQCAENKLRLVKEYENLNAPQLANLKFIEGTEELARAENGIKIETEVAISKAKAAREREYNRHKEAQELNAAIGYATGVITQATDKNLTAKNTTTTGQTSNATRRCPPGYVDFNRGITGKEYGPPKCWPTDKSPFPTPGPERRIDFDAEYKNSQQQQSNKPSNSGRSSSAGAVK